MRVRPARPGDQAALKAFRCADTSHHETEVERWFQHQALKWAARQPTHHLLVLVEEPNPELDPVVIGAVSYEPDEPGVWLISALAISRRHQRRGLGHALLLTTLNAMRTDHPGEAAYWKVDPANERSLQMSDRVGGERYEVAGSDFVLFTVQLLAEGDDVAECAGGSR